MVSYFYLICVIGYYDHGDPTYTRGHCQVFMWYGERINKRFIRSKPIFTMCCGQGKVVLPCFKSPPNSLLVLFCNDDDEISTHFRNFIRAYNMMFSFTSLGGKINHSINNGKGPYLFSCVAKTITLFIGDILPGPGESPCFSQLYIHDTTNEIPNRIAA